jgi:hypothetical protein
MSFGFWPRRSAHQTAGKPTSRGYTVVVDIDLVKFFGRATTIS